MGDMCVVALLALVMTFLFSGRVSAQQNEHHLMLGSALSYERGLDFSLAYQKTTKYHNAWEFFGMYYLKWDEDPNAGHVTKKSFWHNYNSWHLGIAYKPCVNRSRNNHGNLRIGVSGGSDMDRFVGGGHLGYEHTFSLHRGWEVYFQVKEDVIIKGEDIFRTGVGIGLKVPLGDY